MRQTSQLFVCLPLHTILSLVVAQQEDDSSVRTLSSDRQLHVEPAGNVNFRKRATVTRDNGLIWLNDLLRKSRDVPTNVKSIADVTRE